MTWAPRLCSDTPALWAMKACHRRYLWAREWSSSLTLENCASRCVVDDGSCTECHGGSAGDAGMTAPLRCARAKHVSAATNGAAVNRAVRAAADRSSAGEPGRGAGRSAGLSVRDDRTAESVRLAVPQRRHAVTPAGQTGPPIRIGRRRYHPAHPHSTAQNPGRPTAASREQLQAAAINCRKHQIAKMSPSH